MSERTERTEYQVRRCDTAGACGGSVTRYGVYSVRMTPDRYLLSDTLLSTHTTKSDAMVVKATCESMADEREAREAV